VSVLLRKSTSFDPCKLTVAALLIVAACLSGGCVVVYAIRTQYPPNPPKPPIILAAQHGDVRALAAQLDKGVNPEALDSSLRTALMIAAWRGDLEAVRLLLPRRRGAIDIESGYDFMTPLMYAAVRGHSDVVRQLLESGADVNHANRLGQTALLIAVRSKYMMPLLLQDPNLAHSLGRAPSRRAMVEDRAHAGKSAAVIRLLLEHGANVHLLDSEGHDALFYASGDCQSEVVKLLESACAAGRC